MRPLFQIAVGGLGLMGPQQSHAANLCVSDQLVTQIAQEMSEEKIARDCALRFNVEKFAISTTELTQVRRADFNTDDLAIEKLDDVEILIPGEKLAVTDYKVGAHTLVYSVTSHRPFFARSNVVQSGLLSEDVIHNLHLRYPNDTFYTAISAPTTLQNLRPSGDPLALPQGAILRFLDESNDGEIPKRFQVECLTKACRGQRGWVLYDDIAKIHWDDAQDYLFDLVFEDPQDHLAKGCHSADKTNFSYGTKTQAGGGVTVTLPFFSAEVAGEIENAASRGLEAYLDKDIELEQSAFAVAKTSFSHERSRRVLVDQKNVKITMVNYVEHDCETPEQTARYDVVHRNKRAPMGHFQKGDILPNVKEHLKFVRAMRARFTGRKKIKPWLARYIAMSLSGKVR